MFMTSRLSSVVRPCLVWPALPPPKVANLKWCNRVCIAPGDCRWYKSQKGSVLSSGRTSFTCSGSKILAVGKEKMDAPPPGYRANVGVCLVNDEKKVFVAERLDKPGAWQMPQGGVDAGESQRVAAFRELREETGVTSAELVAEVPQWLCYDFPEEVKAELTKRWGTKWNGQAQKWFLFRFTGKEDEIDIKGDGTEPPEFSQWKWMPVEDVIREAVDFKQPVYEAVFEEFSPILDSMATTAV